MLIPLLALEAFMLSAGKKGQTHGAVVTRVLVMVP
jgi:hypothetical protein